MKRFLMVGMLVAAMSGMSFAQEDGKLFPELSTDIPILKDLGNNLVIFGGAEAVIPRIQAMGWDVPIYIVGMLPYMLTLAVLIVPTILRGEKSPAPASLGLNYLRQDRR